VILLIDNYDSFTYNLVQRLGEIGEETVVLRNDAAAPGDIRCVKPSHIIISPGPCTPAQSGISVAVVREFAGRTPLLGVCLGHQAIVAAFGGKVVRAARPMHGKTSQILHDGRELYRGIPNPFTAARYHSLTVDERTLPQCFQVTARTDRGELMGIRHRRFPLEGVQFHPESFLTPHGYTLLRNFIGGNSRK